MNETRRVVVDLRRKLVSIDEACAIVDVSRRTLHNWVTQEKVEYIRTAGGRCRIYVDSLFRGPRGERLEVPDA